MATDVLREVVLPKLDRVKKSGGGFMARCPAHEDSTASLSVTVGRDQPVVFHCLAGETRVITREGTAEIANLAGGVHELLVPSVKGGPARWQKCPVEAFGVQRLWRITLRRHSATKVIHATAAHRWFTQARGPAPKVEVTTEFLRAGDRLASILPSRTVRTVSSFGVAHGFVYGDGSVTARGVECAAQFCGAKDEALLPYFPHMQVRQYGEGVKRVAGLPRFFKETPSITESPAYLLGWLAGYFAADGSVEGHCAAISSADREALEFVRDVCTRLGIVTYPIRQQRRQGFGAEPSDLFKVTLRGADLWPEFFVLPSHRAKWQGGQSDHSRESWVVAAVEESDRDEEVYCATVDGSHAFALEDFILTGNCHAGCSSEDIAKALGGWDLLSKPKPRDDSQPRQSGKPFQAGRWSDVYDYVDERGALIFQVLRSPTKEFRQRKPDPTGQDGWSWKLGDVRRVPYRLPAVLSAVADGREVWVCEGEKDVHALERQGLVATCNPGGAGKWRPEFAEFFREAVVTIVADRDDPGREHARKVRDTLVPVAGFVRIVEAREGKDISDHLTAGLTLLDVDETFTTEPVVKVELAPDLWEFIAVEDEPYDWIVPELLERGDRLLLTGFEGLGKSHLSRQMAVTMAGGVHPFLHNRSIRPARVLVIDCENSARQSRRKYRSIAAVSTTHGCEPGPGMLRLIHRPEGIDLTRSADAEWLMERVKAHKPDVLFIGPFYRLHNADIKDEVAAREAVAVLDAARTEADCAMIIEAHAGHGEAGKNRSVRPVGSSLLLRWPEFGFGIAPCGDPPPGRPCMDVEIRHWRGQRDQRNWPTYLKWGDPGDWPWKVSLGPPMKAKGAP